MTHTVQLQITAQDFRQNFAPAPVGTGRHWLLDHAAGRELLKTKLLQTLPVKQVALWSNGTDDVLDSQMNNAIDELGLRDMPKPEGLVQLVKAEFKLLVLMAKATVGKI